MEEKEDYCILPEKPKEPSQTDCCGSGCSYCVFDVYEVELFKWKKECERLLKGGKLSTQPQTISQLDFKTFKLTGIYPSAKNLNIYRFAVPEGLRLDAKPGQHLIMKGVLTEDGKRGGKMREIEDLTTLTDEMKIEEENSSYPEELKYITRPYTIITNENGHFDILIKLYNDGQMSKYIRRLCVGDNVLWRGPFGEYCHLPSYSEAGSRTILALCAGTGIAPIYGISKSIVNDEDDETRIRILWANHSWEELPLIQEIKELTSYWNCSCKLFFSEGLDGVPPGSKTFYEITEGKINNEILKVELDSFGTDIQVMLCGTTSFEEDIMEFLNKLGLKTSACHRFL